MLQMLKLLKKKSVPNSSIWNGGELYITCGHNEVKLHDIPSSSLSPVGFNSWRYIKLFQYFKVYKTKKVHTFYTPDDVRWMGRLASQIWHDFRKLILTVHTASECQFIISHLDD